MAEESAPAGAEALEAFSAATRAWFEGSFAEPTRAQAGAWRAIGRGQDTLVVAPTGSGKTLAAFLWAIDRLAAAPPPEDPKRRTRVLYVSPLKALAVDIERNLRAPLTGIGHAARRLGLAEPDIHVAVRTGDTAAEDRRRLVSKPPDILITTPESLFLLLTSQARETLRGVETVIVDEVHAVAGNKRGAHLALSLERLDALREQGRLAQRVGLSATVRPVAEVATFLGGTRPVTVVQPPSPKRIELSVVVPVEDMTELEVAPGRGTDGDEDGPAPSRSIWPHVEARVLDLIEQHKSTIVFANSRRLAERLCGRLNELAAERAEAQGVWGGGEPPQERGGSGVAPPGQHCRPRSWRRPGPRRARPRRWPGRTTARCRGRSGPRSRRRSRPGGCPRWWQPPAWNWASTWARSTWWCRWRRRPRWPAACSGWAGPGTTSATCPAASSSPSTRATWSRRRWWPSGCGTARSRS